MKLVFNYLIFITWIFFSASFCILNAQEPDNLDFLDKLLKDLEKMEAGGDQGTPSSMPEPRFDQSYSQPSSFFQSSDASTPTEAEEPKEKKVTKYKDTKELFLNPDVEKIQSKDKKAKTRPTKKSTEALTHFSNEFIKTSVSLQSKLIADKDIPPKFKETKMQEFNKELETTASLLDIIGTKGIYKTSFLEPAKPQTEKGSYKDETKKGSVSPAELRKNFLDILTEVQDLDAMLIQPTEEAGEDQEKLQTIAQETKPKEFPKHKPLKSTINVESKGEK